MAATKKKKAKLFNPRLFPLDLARVMCAALPLFFRVRSLTPTGEKYRHKIRGGAVIAANHYGFSDPLVLFVTFWYRRVFFLVAEIVMKKPIRRLLMKGIGGIEINRHIADMQAMKQSVSLLKQGQIVALFPQGGISKTEEVTTIKSGAVLMALQADVPIYPMHIYPQEKWYRHRTVVIGDPIYPTEICKRKIPSTADIQQITDLLAAKMNQCILQHKEEVK